MPEIEKPGKPVGSDSHLPRRAVHMLLQGKGQEKETRQGAAFQVPINWWKWFSLLREKLSTHGLHAVLNSMMFMYLVLWVYFRESMDLLNPLLYLYPQSI